MEELIKQAFLHAQVVRPLVQEGYYGLVGPDGEIILPTVWEKLIEPGWDITMHMWPMERFPQRPPSGFPSLPPVIRGRSGPSTEIVQIEPDKRLKPAARASNVLGWMTGKAKTKGKKKATPPNAESGA